MSTLLISAMIIAGTIAIFVFIIAVNKKSNRKRTKTLIDTFSLAGAVRGLNFSSQEVLRNKIIGLDGLQQQLLVFDFSETHIFISLPLTEVKDCIVKKEFDTVDYGNAKNPSTEQELRFVSIQFTFKKRSDNFSLTFYDSKINSIYEMKELEAKARDWQLLLTKMIAKDVEVRA